MSMGCRDLLHGHYPPEKQVLHFNLPVTLLRKTLSKDGCVRRYSNSFIARKVVSGSKNAKLIRSAGRPVLVK